jgi:hypothetical protein
MQFGWKSDLMEKLKKNLEGKIEFEENFKQAYTIFAKHIKLA